MVSFQLNLVSMLRSISLWLLFPMLLNACATVPLSGRGGEQPALRPVKPLMEGRGQLYVDKNDKNPSSRVKLETPAKAGKGTSGSKKNILSSAEIKAKLQEAEDKSASARSLSQSAQTPEDWKLVAQQWNKSIALLKPLITSDKSLTTKIQTALSNAQSGLDRANASQNAPKSSGNAPIELDRSKSGKSKGLIYGDIPSPSPIASPSPNPSLNPSPNPSASPTPSPKN
jgi:hypothetical protein